MYINLYSIQSLVEKTSRPLIPEKFIGMQWVEDYGKYLASKKYKVDNWKITKIENKCNRGQTYVFVEIAAMYMEWLAGVSGTSLRERVNSLIYQKQILYFIQCGEFQKIGMTTQLETRISQIQVANPNPIDLIYSIECFNAKKHEKDFHEKYAKKRVSGEWFKLSFAEIQSIKKQMKKLSKEETLVDRKPVKTKQKTQTATEIKQYSLF